MEDEHKGIVLDFKYENKQLKPIYFCCRNVRTHQMLFVHSSAPGGTLSKDTIIDSIKKYRLKLMWYF